MGAIKASGTAVVVGVGAERGLGAALCRRFAAEGYHVLVAGRTPEKITQVAKTICATGGSAEAITVDTTREDDVIRLFDGAMSPHNGRAAADVVIFNAGNNRRRIAPIMLLGMLQGHNLAKRAHRTERDIV